ncbi:hypothetical protein QBC35DRAFT_193587 [Podospora australis]|uniref:Uncharacterized protein n=1 Tax=Podospora australis TaxID=1536484 RepID=A0AAN6WXZ6_9PEZI|nr:hypothetical protein QBC35DRAFT_193587 [Podospora australis]
MSGSTLTVTTPAAVDGNTPLPIIPLPLELSPLELSLPLPHSFSSPQLLSSPAIVPLPPKSTAQPPPPRPDATFRPRANTDKELPGLPLDFEIPSFDFSPEFVRSFSFTSKLEQLTLGSRKPTTTTTERKPPFVEIGSKPAKVIEPTIKPITNPETAVRHKITPAPAPATAAPAPAPKLAPITVDSAVTRAEKQHARTRSKSMIDRPLSWLPTSKSSPNVPSLAVQDLHTKRATKNNVTGVEGDGDFDDGRPLERSRTVESFADFAKRSWIAKSRSPSPPDVPERVRARAASRDSSTEREVAPKTRLSLRGRARSDGEGLRTPDNSSSGGNSTSRVFSRASSYLTRIKQKPQNMFSRTSSPLSLSASSSVKSNKSNESDSPNPPATLPVVTATSPKKTTIPASTIPKTSPVINNIYGDLAAATAAPSRTSSHRTSALESDLDTETTTSSGSENTSRSTADTTITMPNPTSRDPLWGTFRTLDFEFGNLAAKPTTSARMCAVRCVLIPFLRSTAFHPSNSSRTILNSEDLDRRATILNKWWNGLLSMLDAGHSRLLSGGLGLAPGIAALSPQFPVLQPVAGVDRPTLLEAITMVMMRPEWRACTSQFQPLSERSPEERVRARSGTQSTIGSDPESLLSESAEHNVRTMFVNNLTTQMALVVEKMTLRHAPLSLVNWCGKACAYAFFFVPGIADVLVRLWGLNADIIRRVADEFGLPRRSNGESEDIVALYPSHLHRLGWSSVKTMADKLRKPAKLPLMPAKIPWHGSWVSRWRGGETDLFFIFCKYFHILAEQFVPEGLPLFERGRSPAFVLVHAQVLSILDSTIHRQASIDAMLGPPLSDSFHGADATLTGLPVPSNVLKGMDENRLIVLLKDVLSENSIGVNQEIKHTFAEAFAAISKAAAKRTPRFEHAACFMLCDFLEEFLVVLSTFQDHVNGTTTPGSEMEAPRFLEFGSTTRIVEYIDWSFWLEVGKMIADSNNTMSEIRVLSFIYSVWDAITADTSRKEALCLDWLLTEETFAKFFNHWCPMVRAYYMRLLCWRVCRDSGSASEVNNKVFLTMSQRLRTMWAHYLWLKQDAELKGRMHPSTAPCHPTPGKRFLIIRTEVQPPQSSMKLGFDSFPAVYDPNDAANIATLSALYGVGHGQEGGVKDDGNTSSFKRRLSMLGKVLPFSSSQNEDPKRTWVEELEQARRETSAARTGSQPGPPPPPKKRPSHSATLSSDSFSSTGSSPVFEAATYVFRFALTWQTGPGGGPMPLGPTRDRILTRPRLPAPAQARVSARSVGQSNIGNHDSAGFVFRSDSPPPIAPGLPPETRRVSGLLQTGLISEARNARPLSAVDHDSKPRSDKRRLSLSINVRPLRTVDNAESDDDRSTMSPSSVRLPSFDGYESDRCRSFDGIRGEMPRPAAPAIRAEQPTGVFTSTAVYTGRALAEWAIVVNECNSFVDRRRDEGVLGLSDVEIPILGVDGLGMKQRG